MVIPALNEQDLVAAAIRSVSADAAEVIVVDGGSVDGTVGVALRAGACVLTAPRGRGSQLAAGAERAGGDWLVFLHADTPLEAGWAGCLGELGPEIVGGAFRFAVDSPRRIYRWIEAGVRLRCALFRLPYGDQGIFVRRETYDLIGGFAPYPLMEDVAFIRRLRRAGRLGFPGARAFTSPRRWERHGIVSTSLHNCCLLALYAAGWPPERLARFYGERQA